jgi:[ribosomal protein S5]-alanine N-acetyltransferase
MIVLQPYDHGWPLAFVAEAKALSQALGGRAIRIEHVGSTSVSGLAAKPVVDIQVSVRDLSGFADLAACLARLGYHHVPLGDFDRVYPFFQKPAGWPATFHVHLCVAGGEQERRHLAFRDHLRRHPAVAADYLALKRRLAGQFAGDTFESREQYSLAKSSFVEAVLAEALRVPQVAGCILSPAQPADAEEWSEFETLPEFKRHTSSTVATAADLLALIERSRSGDLAAPVHFVVRDGGTGQLVASVGFHTISPVNRTAELTYGVRPSFWGRGLATSLCRAAVEWGFSQRAWVRIQATTLESNIASQRVLQKAGFILEGRLRNFRLVRGAPHDYLLYASIPAPP